MNERILAHNYEMRVDYSRTLKATVGAALRGRPSVEFDTGAATEGRPYSYPEYRRDSNAQSEVWWR